MNESPVRLIITGGTFDKHYDELKGVLTFKDSHLPEILKQVRVTAPVELQIVQLIDSLEMTDEHRGWILEACRSAPERRIVITHGTDRMPETARFLGRAGIGSGDAAGGGKTVVLTGAMVPYQLFGSDSLFNLGSAFMAATLLSPGVFIAMNGRAISWETARKDFGRGVFVEGGA